MKCWALSQQYGGISMRPYKGTRQPILMLDVCNAHMGVRFLRALARWNIWAVFIPGRTTWLLQPCDTHCFAQLKRALRTMFEQSLLDNQDGTVYIKTVILHLNRAIRQVVQGKEWSSAFDGNGWSHGQKHARLWILRTLELSSVPARSDALPTLRQLQAIFPKRRSIPLGAMLNHYRVRQGGREPMAPPLHLDPDIEPVATAGPWHGRLRSSSQIHKASSESFLLEGRMHREDSPPPLPPPACPPAAPPPRPLPLPSVPPTRPAFPVARPLLPPRRLRVVRRSPSSPRREAPKPAKYRRTSTP